MENQINPDELPEYELFNCTCTSMDHQITISYFKDDPEPDVFVHIRLAKRPFWKRVKHAVKYIFGYQSRYGAYDEIVLGPENIDKLERVIEHLKSYDGQNSNRGLS